MRRVDLIQHYESAQCLPAPYRQISHTISGQLETAPLLPTTVDLLPTPAPFIATPQSWNEHTRRYKCYLCNPVLLGFHTLARLNEHLADPDHQAKRYQCPHLACNLPFKTIEGLVQHIELRSCRCVTDSTWWNPYFALQDATWTVTETAPAESRPELDLEEYWMRRYFEMTGHDGRWIYRRGLFSEAVRQIARFFREAESQISRFFSELGSQLRRFFREAGSQSGRVFRQAALRFIYIVRILLPVLPPIIMIALLATATYFLYQLVSFVIVAIINFVIDVFPAVIEDLRLFIGLVIDFITYVVEIVRSAVSTVVHAIVDFVSNVLGAVGRGL